MARPWDIAGKTALITGANSGIGKETARGLAHAGAHVVMACRSLARGGAAREEILEEVPDAHIEVMELDLADLDDVRAFADRFRREHKRLHVLLNNAGVYHRRRTVTAQGHEATFGVNHLGHFLLTDLLLPILKRSAPARIITVSSAMHKRGRMDLEDLHKRGRYSGVQAYADSKLANILFSNELARRLEGTKVTSNVLHPGAAPTGIFRELPGPLMAIVGRFLDDVGSISATSIYLATSDHVTGVSGRYFRDEHEAEPAPRARDAGMARRLWTESERLVGIQ